MRACDEEVKQTDEKHSFSITIKFDEYIRKPTQPFTRDCKT